MRLLSLLGVMSFGGEGSNSPFFFFSGVSYLVRLAPSQPYIHRFVQ